MLIKHATISKTGKRHNNEDALRVLNHPEVEGWTGIACDGLGGHDNGEVASEIVANSIAAYWEEFTTTPDTDEKVKKACDIAFDNINERSKAMNYAEMGTTLVMASIRRNSITIANLGDSRCYLIRPRMGVIFQTIDHTEICGEKEVLNKCFFPFRRSVVKPDIFQTHLMDGDRILICTDGIYKSTTQDNLIKIMREGKTPEDIIQTLDDICEIYGLDNYTAIVAFVSEGQKYPNSVYYT